MLESQVFEDSLDDDVTLAKLIVICRGYNSGHEPFTFYATDLLSLDFGVDTRLDLGETASDAGVIHVLQDGLHALVKGDLTNAGSHQTCADNADHTVMQIIKLFSVVHAITKLRSQSCSLGAFLLTIVGKTLRIT